MHQGRSLSSKRTHITDSAQYGVTAGSREKRCKNNRRHERTKQQNKNHNISCIFLLDIRRGCTLLPSVADSWYLVFDGDDPNELTLLHPSNLGDMSDK